MKIAVIGGAGVRTVIFINGLLARYKALHIDEVALYDINQEKQQIITKLCRHVVNRNHKDLIVTESADVRKVLQDADYVVTTLRVGGDHSRVMDETIALNAGVIGQETTGVGGFSMAVRTIPILLEYCRLINEIAPNAWIFNFTNPSGLVTQALKSAGYEKVIGICDAPSSTKFRMAAKRGGKRSVCGILRFKSPFLDSQREDQGRGDSAQAPCGRRIFKEHSGIFHVRSRFVADDRIFAE